MAKGRAYLGLGRLITIILAIIPPTNIVLGIVERLKRGKVLGIILNIILCPIFYVVDLVTIILFKDITIFA